MWTLGVNIGHCACQYKKIDDVQRDRVEREADRQSRQEFDTHDWKIHQSTQNDRSDRELFRYVNECKSVE